MIKNVSYCGVILGLIILVNTMFLCDYGGGFVLYEQRHETKVGFVTPIPSVNFKVPRFYGDVFLYAPLTLVDGINAFVVEPDVNLDSQPTYVGISVESRQSLGVVYLHALTKNSLELPIHYNSGYGNYDLSVYSERTKFNLVTMDIDKLEFIDKQKLLSVLTDFALTDLNSVGVVQKYSIIEVTSTRNTKKTVGNFTVEEMEKLYLWCYELNEHSAYVFDPTNAEGDFNRVDLASMTYSSVKGDYIVTNVFTKEG